MRLFGRGRARAKNPAKDLSRLLDGYRSTCLLLAAVRTGVVDRLGAGPATTADLATALGAHPPSLDRFLHGLASFDVVEEDGGRYGLTALGRQLLPGSSLRDETLLVGEEYVPAWTSLAHAVLTGRAAFDHVFRRSVWERRGERPDLDAAFNRYMARFGGRTLEAFLQAFDFSRAGAAGSLVVVDVGAGHGRVLAGVLGEHRGARGVAFDLPHVVEGAVPVLQAAGVSDRARTIGGSFLEFVPAGGDVYLLGRILHNWDDEACKTVLRNVRAAMNPGGTLLVAERALEEGSRPPRHQVMVDLQMLVLLGGAKRTRSDLSALVSSAGFEPVRWGGLPGDTDVLEAAPRAS